LDAGTGPSEMVSLPSWPEKIAASLVKVRSIIEGWDQFQRWNHVGVSGGLRQARPWRSAHLVNWCA